MNPLCPWIFKDDLRISTADRDLLCLYLRNHNIVLDEHFKKALGDDNDLAWWWYPAFAVKHFPSDPVLVKKLSLLCRIRGSNDNDIERNYQNQLVEFHALYACVALIGYQFDGWDKPSGKTGADLQKNCDLAFTKNKEKFFADAKDCSSEILSQDENPQHRGMIHYTPKVELNTWMKNLIKNVEQKGADILVCHTPGWGLTSLDEPTIKQWLDSILPSVLSWGKNGPRWPIESKSVSQIVIIKRGGCFIIQTGK
jgi:hypothetical protein